jgi:hypothetical protein
MRFGKKFGLWDGWYSIGFVCYFVFVLLVERHPSLTDRILASLWVLIATVHVLDQFFFYWELEPVCLRQRRFWTKKEVAWESVTVVRDYTLWGLPSDWLEVDFSCPAKKSGRGRILARPRDRAQFIATVRDLAPQAVFVV